MNMVHGRRTEVRGRAPADADGRDRGGRGGRHAKGATPPPSRRWRGLDIAVAIGGLLVLAAASIWLGPLGGRPPAMLDSTPSAPPSASPSPAASAVPSAATLEFDPVDLAGQGTRRVAFDIPPESAAVARISNTGAGAFQVQSLGRGDAPGDLLVDTAGDYSGLVLFDALTGQHTTAFQVRSGGDWTIRVEPVGLAPIWSGSIPLAGTGDDVALLDAPSADGSTIHIEHRGQGPLTVLAFTASGELDQLVDTAGPVDEVHDLPPGTICLQVRAAGAWTLSPD
jgi:hypothetical protein